MIGFLKNIKLGKKKEQDQEKNNTESKKTTKNQDQVTKFSGVSKKEEYRKEKAKRKEIALQKRKKAEKEALEQHKLDLEKKKKEASIRENERKVMFEQRQLAKQAKKEQEEIKYESDEDLSFDLFGYEVKDLKQGMIIEVEVVSENKDEYFVEADNNFKEIYFPKEEAQEEIIIGSTYEVVIYRQTNDDLYVSQKRLSQKKQLQKFNDIYDSNELVSGKIIGYEEPNFEVKIDDGFFALLYKNNYQLNFLENPENLVGEETEFLIKNNKARGKYSFELTRIPVLIQELERNISEVEVGKKILVGDYTKNKGGLTFNHKGFEIFVPNREISFDYITAESDLTTIIDENTQCEIIKCQKNRFGYKVTGSIKKTLSSPFELFIENNEVGSEVTGEIIRKENYGLFIELAKNQRGLLHQSDFSNETSALIKDLKIGDQLTTIIKEINLEKEQINLKSK